MSQIAGGRLREAAVAAAAAGAGLAIALMDASPGFDDTGITAISLFCAGALAAAVARKWVLMILLVGAWTPAIEIIRAGQSASLAALAFAGGGGLVGHWVALAALARTSVEDGASR